MLVFDEPHPESVRALLYPDEGAWTIVFLGSEGERSIEIILRDEMEDLLDAVGSEDADREMIRLVDAALRGSGFRPSEGLLEPDALAGWALSPA